MANASDFRIAGNDEHGIDPPTYGKRTPVMPYIGRPFYENEFNRPTKYDFLAGCARLGFLTFDVKPERSDISISTRVTRANNSYASLAVTYAYNATANLDFNSWGGLEVFYAPQNGYATRSRLLSNSVYRYTSQNGYVRGNGVMPLSGVGMLGSVRMPATLVEGGFMTNFFEAKLMVDPDYQALIADETARGVCAYLSVPYRSAQSTVYPTLRSGSRGTAVSYLQYMLVNYGYAIGTDGVFGPATAAAVKDFQTKNGLTADGIVGPATWTKVNNFYPQNTTLRQGMRGVEVRYLQQKLLSKLYPVGTVDGVFGPNTKAQVQAFQAETGLSADGIVGPATWARVRPIGGGRPLN